MREMGRRDRIKENQEYRERGITIPAPITNKTPSLTIQEPVELPPT
jgi:hypothetical protein